jgi:hypothetical protein
LERDVSGAVSAELEGLLATLLAASAASEELTLDAVGEALGDRPVSSVEIDWLIGALERAGRRLVGGEGRGGLEALRIVLPAARRLSQGTGRAPTVRALTTETGLEEREVRRALLLARTLGR